MNAQTAAQTAALAATLEQIQAADSLTMLLAAATPDGFVPQESLGWGPETIYDLRDRTYLHYLEQADDAEYAAWRTAFRAACDAAATSFDRATDGFTPEMVEGAWFAVSNALRAAAMIDFSTTLGVADQAAALAYRWAKAVATRSEMDTP